MSTSKRRYVQIPATSVFVSLRLKVPYLSEVPIPTNACSVSTNSQYEKSVLKIILYRVRLRFGCTRHAICVDTKPKKKIGLIKQSTTHQESRSLENEGQTGSSRKIGPVRFSSNMLPFKGSLFPERLAYMGLFFRKETKRFFQRNLVRTEILLFMEILLNPRDFAVSRFEQKSRCVSFPKDLKRGPYRLGCLSRKRLPLKGSILLQYLIGPSFLELPVQPPFSRERLREEIEGFPMLAGGQQPENLEILQLNQI